MAGSFFLLIWNPPFCSGESINFTLLRNSFRNSFLRPPSWSPECQSNSPKKIRASGPASFQFPPCTKRPNNPCLGGFHLSPRFLRVVRFPGLRIWKCEIWIHHVMVRHYSSHWLPRVPCLDCRLDPSYASDPAWCMALLDTWPATLVVLDVTDPIWKISLAFHLLMTVKKGKATLSSQRQNKICCTTMNQTSSDWNMVIS